jgi:hypothetical protein
MSKTTDYLVQKGYEHELVRAVVARLRETGLKEDDR